LWCKSNILDGCREGLQTSIRNSPLSVVRKYCRRLSAFRHLRKARGSAHRTRALAAPHIQHQDAHRGGTRLVRGRTSARRLFSRREARRRRGLEALRGRGSPRPFPDASLHRRPRRRAVLGRGRGGPQPGVRSAAPRLSSSRPTRRSRSAISLPRRASPDGTSSPAIRVRTPNATVRLCSAFLARAFPLVFTF
jgi:hypothetical protein